LRPFPPADNRWQQGSVVDALYLTEDEATLWAEWYRHLAEAGVPPQRALPRDLWRIKVSALRIADLSSAMRLARVDLEPPLPGRRTWLPYQRVGETLWNEGWLGLVSPSAARPEGLVLCLFINEAGSFPVEPIPPPIVVEEPPAPPQGMRT